MRFLIFSYLPFPFKDPTTSKIIGEVFRPVIPIRFSYRHQFLKYSINSLVDSGSDRNLFPAEIGHLLKMKVKTKKPKKIEGIGKNLITVYTHNITLFVDGKRIDTSADFSYEHPMPILGRNGFFNHFKKIIFDERAKTVSLGF